MKVTQEGLAKLLAMSASVEDRPLAQVNLARAILAAGEEDKARELAQMAMRRAPEDSQVRVLAAEVLRVTVVEYGDFDGVIAVFELRQLPYCTVTPAASAAGA